MTLAALAALAAAPTAAQEPLSAIDWLSDVLAEPVAQPLPDEPDVTDGIGQNAITVTPLDSPSPDAAGLLPASVSGLPADLWGASSSAQIAERLARIDLVDLLPGTRALLSRVLLAELHPPADAAAAPGMLLLARVDTLIRLGDVEPAKALLERAGTDEPERFRRWFDLSLLLGTENEACKQLQTTPGLAPTLAARVFCLARLGDWTAAALTLGTARVLGAISGDELELLHRFLDPEHADGAPPLTPPDRPSPLEFRLFEAIGEPLPTAGLPLAFAHADLRSNSGWKTQLEAAERLTRAGALPANKLLGLYTLKRPAASGGVWDRVAAVQAFDLALATAQPEVVSARLAAAWNAMKAAGLGSAFAELYGDRLAAVPLTGHAAAIAFRVRLLTSDRANAAKSHAAADAQEAFLSALAQGSLKNAAPPDERSAAIAEGFLAEGPPEEYAAMLRGGFRGIALLRAIRLFGTGAAGDMRSLTDAIAVLRALDLEEDARRTALEVLILDPRG